MGKVRARLPKARLSPTGLPSMAEVAKAGLLLQSQPAEVPKNVHPLLAQLASDDACEQEFACGALSSIVLANEYEKAALDSLLAQGLVSRLVQCLTSQRAAVVADAAECLYNLCVSGGHDVSLQVLEAGAVKALAAVLPLMVPGLSLRIQSGNGSDDVEGPEARAVEGGLNLLGALCEDAANAVKELLGGGLVPILIGLVQTNGMPPSVVVAAAQCMQIIIEDTREARQALNASDVKSNLVAAASAPAEERDYVAVMARVSYAGLVLLANENRLDDVSATPVVGAMQQALQIDTPSLILAAQAVAAKIPESAISGHPIKSVERQAAEAEVEKACNALSAQHLALDLLTNMCAANEKDEWEDIEENDDDTEMMRDEGESCMANQIDAMEEDDVAKPAWVTYVQTSALPSMALSCLQCLPPDVDQSLRGIGLGRMLLSDLRETQRAACRAVSNMLMEADLSGVMVVSPIDAWNCMAQCLSLNVIGKDGPEMATTLLEKESSNSIAAPTEGQREREAEETLVVGATLLAALWTAARVIKKNKSLCATFRPSTIQLQQIEQQIPVGEECAVNAVGLLGTLYQLPQMQDSPEAKGIALVLLTLLDQSSLPVVAEALHAMYDSFLTRDTVSAHERETLVPRLTAVRPRLEAQRRQLRRQGLPGDVIGRIDEALFNLPRFIDYLQE